MKLEHNANLNSETNRWLTLYHLDRKLQGCYEEDGVWRQLKSCRSVDTGRGQSSRLRGGELFIETKERKYWEDQQVTREGEMIPVDSGREGIPRWRFL